MVRAASEFGDLSLSGPAWERVTVPISIQRFGGHFCNICHYDKLTTCQGVSHLHPRASAYLKRIVPWGHRPAETTSTEPNFYTGLKFGCKC